MAIHLNTLELYFGGSIVDAQLIESRFTHGSTGLVHTSVRGKTAGALSHAGTFQWTSAVKALCALSLKTLIAELRNDKECARIEGVQGSLASSLDYALSKQPCWVAEMCGMDALGNAYLRRLLLRTNPERKRPGPVVLSFNRFKLPAASIKIFWDGREVSSIDELSRLLSAVVADAHAEWLEQTSEKQAA